ncbi:MAG: HEAT repeat domain-containing protein [Acidobacteria bacterium]|nr:HEAT repeat domain-containing protein [Acidobacteriota bacterium]
MKSADPKLTAGRAFVRSLNILLKFARLYGFDHVRTTELLDVAFRELHTAIPESTDAGLLLGATGNQLLLDGVPLEGSPAEKQFAALLSTAGLASVQFFPTITQDELSLFARAFPTGKTKPSELAEQLKASLSGAPGVRINEICFVATDSRFRDANRAAQLAAATLGDDQDEFKRWLNDPQKLLEMIAAAQGVRSGSGGGPGSGPGSGGNYYRTGTGSGDVAGSGGGASGTTGTSSGDGFYYRDQSIEPASDAPASDQVRPGADPNFFTGPVAEASTAIFGVPGASTGATTSAQQSAGADASPGGRRGFGAEPTEDEILGILSALTSMGQVSAGGGSGMAAAGAFHEQMSQLPGRAQNTLKAALAEIAAHAPAARPDQSTLIQLAEHLAIKFALDRYEKGDVKVNAVRQMLDRLNIEIETLRKLLGSHEEKMSDAGMVVETHREILDRQFWAAVPESGKRTVLLSTEAWCIPPRNVQSYVGELVEQGNVADAVSVLQNYAACADSEDNDARKKTAAGLSEMAELYAKLDPRLLGAALQHLGLRLNVEQDAELQAVVSAAFVRLSQQAASSRCYGAMEQALDLLSGVEAAHPGAARTLRGKMGIEERVPEFVEEALRARQAAAGLTSVLKMLPQTTMEQLALRFNRCTLRNDAEHVANLAADLGEEGVQYLRSTLRGGAVAEAVEIVGLLCKLDPRSVEVFLPARIKEFPRNSQDRVLRQISASGSAGRCRILLEVLDFLDPLVMPLAVDEIGVSGDREGLGRLLTIVDGDLPAGGGTYLRIKAVEALGRINAPEAVAALKRIVEAKKFLGWMQPPELRITAIQALAKLDPAWAVSFLPQSGLDRDDLALAPLTLNPNSKFVRQRRHKRVRLAKPVLAVSTNLKEACSLQIKTASLAGGVATISRHLAPGTPVQLKFQIGLRNLQATALMRDYRAQDMAFEIVDITLEERSRLRRLLAEHISPRGSTPEDHAAGAETPVPIGTQR